MFLCGSNVIIPQHEIRKIDFLYHILFGFVGLDIGNIGVLHHIAHREHRFLFKLSRLYVLIFLCVTNISIPKKDIENIDFLHNLGNREQKK